MSPWQVLVSVLWGILIVAGYYLGKRKGRTADGVWLAVILGPIGLAITTFGLRTRPPEPAPPSPRTTLSPPSVPSSPSRTLTPRRPTAGSGADAP